jgi:hypothetical protein
MCIIGDEILLEYRFFLIILIIIIVAPPPRVA